MNRILSFVFVACLAMLSFGAFAQTTYVKVTNASQLVDGGKYLIVYEEGNVALDGSLTSLDVVSNTKAVTISGTAISVTDNDFYFTLDVVDGGYSVKSASGYFIGNTSDANALKTSQTEAYVNTIEVTASTTEIISANTHLRFNSASDQNRFKYFKSTTYTNQKAISLFVDAASLSDNPMISIITPVNGSTIYYSSSVTATVQVLNFTVGTDGNISFAIDSEDAIVGTETSHTFTNITDGQHTIHASLVGTDENVIVTATSTFTINNNGPTTTPIHDIQYTEAEDGASPYNEQTVTVRGTVTGFNSDKFYIQDAEEAWSGLYIYNTTSSWTPALSDNVTVTGAISEYNGLTELTPTEIINNGASTPINGLTLAGISEIGEAYESVLVTVTGTCTNIGGAKKWTISDGTSIVVFGLTYTPTVGTTYTVTGIVDWFGTDGIWELKPRSEADIVAGAAVPAISITNPANGSEVYASSVNATVEVLNFTPGTDGNISFSIDEGAAVSGTATSHTFEGLEDGEHTITASLVGNDQSVVATTTSTFTVNLAGPTYTTIHDIQYTEDESGDSPLNNQTVWVKGIVTSNFINTPYFPVKGYSIQDANEAWSGIWVFDSNNNPNIGDSVRFQALVTEYYGLTELKNVANFEIYAQGTVSPIDVTANEANSEAYEGCYVRVECVRSVGHTMPYGNWACVNETGDTVTFSHNFENNTYTIEDNARYMVSGVVEYSYGKYYVNYPTIDDIATGCNMGPSIIITNPANRSEVYVSSVNATVEVLDFTPGTDGNISFSIDEAAAVSGTATSHTFEGLEDGQHTIHASLVGNDQNVIVTATSTFTVNLAGPTYTTIRDIQYTTNESGDSPLKDRTVWVKGVVTSNFTNTPYFPVKGYSIQDANDAWSGVWVFDSINNPNIGDSVKLQALVTEYYGLTELKNVANYEVFDIGVATPINVTVNEAKSEAYEGCYVRVECVRSTGHTMPYGNWTCVNAAGDTVTFSHNFANDAYTIQDDKYYSVAGVVEYSYGKYYVNYPTVNDIIADCDASVDEMLATSIEVYPNPTNGQISIANAEGKSIVVINTLGQVVAHIDNASENQTIDMSGLCEGTYFVKVGTSVVKINVIR